jgi:diguanylate cyclase (GGDEF)-like protein/PAS domain S-box-containing protein
MTEPCPGLLDENVVRFEVVLDEIIEVAIAISGADFGNIQLIDPKTSDLRIVAHRGFPAWWLDFWNSVSAGHGVCGTALECGTRVIVEDVELSPIFIGTPALEIQRKAGVRAVQSTPIITRKGKAIGMFSTHYKTPKQPDERGLLLLDLLARQAADLIERKQAEEALEQTRNMLDEAQKIAHLGSFEYEAATQTTKWSKEEYRIYGLDPAGPSPEYNDLLARYIHPDDAALLHVTFTEAMRKNGIYELEHRIVRPNGCVRWVYERAHPYFDADGKLLHYVGATLDITERKQAEQAIKDSERRLAFALEASGAAVLELQTVLDAIPAAVFIANDPECRDIRSNPAGSRIFATQTDDNVSYSAAMPDRTVDYKVFDPADRELLANELPMQRAAIEGRTVDGTELRLQFHNGRQVWLYGQGTPLFTHDGVVRGAVGVFSDITERKQVEQALKESEEKFRATFEHAPLGIAEATIDGRIIDANAKLVEMLGYTKEELMHMTVRELTHPSELENSLDNLRKLVRGEAKSCVMEKRYLGKDRSLIWVNVTASLTSVHGKPQFMVLTVEDISTRKQIEQDLKLAMDASYHQANHDILTGLANRVAFHDRLKEALAYAKRDDHLVALHLLDLDRFKSINDTLGHHTGDLLLQEVARRTKSHVRASDLVARLGGDEFVVIQTHLAEPAAAAVLASKLVEELKCTYVLEGQEVHSGASIGVALFPKDANHPEDLIKHADLALYEAKHRGRFNYQFYRQELGAAFVEAQQLEQDLARALRENQFCLHYQPQFDLKNGGRITGIEALLRWQHPERGLLAASEFLLEAEHAKLMLPLGEWTLQTACRQHRAWIDAGLAVPLTLNLSSIQLRDPRLLETLKRTLEETGLPAPMLQLEMRESVLWDPKCSKSLLSKMKDCGLRLALDNFGAEMTALSSLDKFLLDAVKPGHRLVNRLPSHSRDAALLAAIICVAHNLNIAVCADGVETDDQLAAVKEKGCDSAQGYWLSSPLDAQKMKQRIEAELMH